MQYLFISTDLRSGGTDLATVIASLTVSLLIYRVIEHKALTCWNQTGFLLCCKGSSAAEPLISNETYHEQIFIILCCSQVLQHKLADFYFLMLINNCEVEKSCEGSGTGE